MGHKKPDLPGSFLDNMGEPLKESVHLRDYSNFKIGGKADYFFEAMSVPELVKSILLAREHSFPYFVIGGGYNLLFDDDGFRGLIIKHGVKGIKEAGKKEEIEALRLKHIVKLEQKEAAEKMLQKSSEITETAANSRKKLADDMAAIRLKTQELEAYIQKMKEVQIIKEPTAEILEYPELISINHKESKSKKAKAFLLFSQGKRPSDSEVKALGIKPTSAYRYYQDWKKVHCSR